MKKKTNIIQHKNIITIKHINGLKWHLKLTKQILQIIFNEPYPTYSINNLHYSSQNRHIREDKIIVILKTELQC